MTEILVFALMVIGVISVVLLTPLVLYIAAFWLLFGIQRGLTRGANWAFRRGDGRVHGPEQTGRWPDEPWGRISMELVWLKRVVRWVRYRLGMTDLVSCPFPTRPESRGPEVDGSDG